MGKKEKAAVETVGRVSLVQGDKPLIYRRYNSIEDLIEMAQGAGTSKDGHAKANASAVVERPSKKQKILSAAATAEAQAEGDNATAAAPAKGFSVIGEDGLTYKQRRQMRRAAERAAKAQAEAEGAVAASVNGTTVAASTSGLSGNMEEASGDGQQRTKNKDKEKGRAEKRGMKEATAAGAGTDGAAAVLPAAAPSATVKGNADEAARMRAVLGFTNGSGGGRSGGVSLAALAASAQAATQVAAEGRGGPDTAGAGGTAKRKEDKKGKKDGKEKNDKMAPLADAQDGPPQQQPGQEAEGTIASGSKLAKGAKGKGGARDSDKLFSFEFQIQAEVEAETEARLARIMALDSCKDGFRPRRVWVSGMPHEFDADTVREYWGYCGEVEDMHLLTFRDSGNFNGAAFITFKTQEGYEAALACSGEVLEGRVLRVERCKVAAEVKGKERVAVGGGGGGGMGAGAGPGSKAGAAASACGVGKVAGYPVAYCGNISFEVGPEDLQHFFSRGGAVPTKVRLHTDKNTGRSKGYAHVHFANDEDVDKAVALDGTTLRGRKIRVSYAQPKPGES